MSNQYKRDDFGNRMKTYEKLSESKLIPNLPIIARLDGKGFSKYTRYLNKPYDERFISTMQRTARHLMKVSSHIILCYTQSDEITLVLSNDYDNPVEYDGRIQKLCSVLAASASSYFSNNVEDFQEQVLDIYPVFDCRIFNVPNWVEASNAVLWRQQDATKNSIQCAGQSVFSHKEMQGLTNNQVQEKLLLEKDINWNDYPYHFKRGSFVMRRKIFDEKLGCERSNFIIEDIDLRGKTLEERMSLLFDM